MKFYTEYFLRKKTRENLGCLPDCFNWLLGSNVHVTVLWSPADMKIHVVLVETVFLTEVWCILLVRTTSTNLASWLIEMLIIYRVFYACYQNYQNISVLTCLNLILSWLISGFFKLTNLNDQLNDINFKDEKAKIPYKSSNQYSWWYRLFHMQHFQPRLLLIPIFFYKYHFTKTSTF